MPPKTSVEQNLDHCQIPPFLHSWMLNKRHITEAIENSSQRSSPRHWHVWLLASIIVWFPLWMKARSSWRWSLKSAEMATASSCTFRFQHMWPGLPRSLVQNNQFHIRVWKKSPAKQKKAKLGGKQFGRELRCKVISIQPSWRDYTQRKSNRNPAI